MGGIWLEWCAQMGCGRSSARTTTKPQKFLRAVQEPFFPANLSHARIDVLSEEFAFRPKRPYNGPHYFGLAALPFVCGRVTSLLRNRGELMNWKCVLAFGLTCVWGTHVSATTFPQDKHFASDPQINGVLGYSVSLSGDLAIAGAPNVGPANERSGAAYLYRRVGDNIWVESDKLTATPVAGADPLLGDQFGFSVAISGNVAVIGANSSSASGNDSGLAYIFDVTGGTGTQVVRLIPSDAGAQRLFGTSVAAGPGRALIGARGAGPGSAYVFEPDSGGAWTQRGRLSAADGAANDGFGISVALSGDRAIVGAYEDDSPLGNAGSAYVFQANAMGQWSQVAKLTADDANADDSLGISVAIEGNTALVGAWKDDERGPDAGAAYLFQETTPGSWEQVAKFTASDAEAGDRFGTAVALHGSNAIISAPSDGADQGAAYLFHRDAGGAWSEVAKLRAFDGGPSDAFGSSVGLHRGNLVVGAPGESFASGAVYFLQVPEPSVAALFAMVPFWRRRIAS
jgi:hypothetical protein